MAGEFGWGARLAGLPLGGRGRRGTRIVSREAKRRLGGRKVLLPVEGDLSDEEHAREEAGADRKKDDFFPRDWRGRDHRESLVRGVAESPRMAAWNRGLWLPGTGQVRAGSAGAQIPVRCGSDGSI